MARALVVDESLKQTLPSEWSDRLISSRPYSLRTLGNVTISEYSVQDDCMIKAGSVLASNLREPRFYGHVVSDSSMIVSFPNIIVLLQRESSKLEFERCRKIGVLFGIPREEMQFEAMFDVDHPDKE